MSFIDCIRQNASLKPSQQEKLIKDYNRLYKNYSKRMGDTIGAEAAAKKFVEIQSDIIKKKQENTARDILAWENVSEKIDNISARIKTEKASAGKAGRFLWGKVSEVAAVREILENVYTRQQAIERRSTLAIAEQIEKYRSKAAGLTQDTEGFLDVTRALLGEKVENSLAAQDGKAIRAVFDNLHKTYQESGGILGRLDNYYPQTHNPDVVSKAGFPEWRDKITPLLDREKIVDGNGIPLEGDDFTAALKAAYDGIRTNGLNELSDLLKEGRVLNEDDVNVALRRSSSRFFHFKDADSFIKYNREFGYGDAGLFDAMLGYINNMARDIAIMQDLGPKPQSQIKRIKLKAQVAGASKQSLKTIQGMYDILSGRNSFTGELPTWYKTTQALQNLLRSAYLGSAPVSALSDSFMAVHTARLNGLEASNVIKQYGKILNPKNDSDRRVARRIGFIAGAASGSSIAQARMVDDFGGHGLTSWLASFTNRASGLGVMTDAVRQSIVLGTQGFMAEARALKTTFKDLPREMKEAFERWDITEEDYKNIIKSNPFEDADSEANFIRPEDVSIAGYSDSARKYEMWLIDMAQDASNEPRLLTRAITSGSILGDASQGTALKALSSSVMMFKSYGITVILNHLLPALRQAATAQGLDRISQIVPLLIGTTILGAASLQARQVLYGKTTRDMDDTKFWRAAMLQGGGFGIFSDFIFSDMSRAYTDITKTTLGPVYGFGNDVYRVFKGNFDKALDEDTDTKFFADLYQFGKKNIPAVKLWYTRLLIERMLLDQGERLVDPKFDQRMRNIENKMKRDYGQEFWWAPGELTPEF
jgi:hypothetical protein